MNIIFSTVLAQTINNKAIPSLSDFSAAEFFGNLIPALISLGLVIGAIVFLAYFLTGAISWISSGGDKMKIEQAKSKITTALIGLFVLLCFIGIIALFERFFGIGMRRIEIGPFHIELTGDNN